MHNCVLCIQKSASDKVAALLDSAAGRTCRTVLSIALIRVFHNIFRRRRRTVLKRNRRQKTQTSFGVNDSNKNNVSLSVAGLLL